MTKGKVVWFAIAMAALMLAVEFITMFGIGTVYGIYMASQGMNINEMKAAMSGLTFQYIFMMIYYIILFFIYYFWYRYLLKRDKAFRIRGAFGVKNVLLILLCGVLMQIFTRFVLTMTAMLMPHIFQDYTKMVSGYTSQNASVILTIITMGVLAPVVEEIIFRGMIYRTLRKQLSILPALLIEATLFGVVHLNLIQFFYTVILGLVLGMVYERTRTLKLPILFHSAYNMSTFALAAIAGNKAIASIILLACSIPAAVAVVYIVNKLDTPATGLLRKTKGGVR